MWTRDGHLRMRPRYRTIVEIRPDPGLAGPLGVGHVAISSPALSTSWVRGQVADGDRRGGGVDRKCSGSRERGVPGRESAAQLATNRSGRKAALLPNLAVVEGHDVVGIGVAAN